MTAAMKRKGLLNLLVLGLGLAAVCACSDPYSPLVYSLKQPDSLAFSCTQKNDDGSLSPRNIEDCRAPVDSSYRLMAYVGGAYLGSVNVIDLRKGRPLDLDESVPGYTGRKIGEHVSDLWASADGMILLVAESTTRAVHVVQLPAVKPLSFTGLEAGEPLFFVKNHAEPWLFTAEPAQLLQLDPDTGAALETYPLPGIPSDASWIEERQRFLIGFRDLGRLMLLNPVDGTSVMLGLGPECADGLDNDGDGLSDQLDPECLEPSGKREAPACVADGDCPVSACSNGKDDDGDGLADRDDPGCSWGGDSSEAENLASCGDGIDNDDDGKTDAGEDPDCTEAGACEGPAGSCPDLSLAFPCSDGLDQDADGLIDWNADPGCYSAGWPLEGGQFAPWARLTVLPGGRWVYAAHAGMKELFVLDLDAGRTIDLWDDAARPGVLLRKEARMGFPLSLSVLDLSSFVDAEGFTNVVLAGNDGMLTVIRALGKKGEPLHTMLIEDQDATDSRVLKPRLYFQGREIELGYSPRAEYPHLGPLSVVYDAEKKKYVYYGVELGDDIMEHRSETWTLTFEGVIPATDGITVLHRAPGIFDLPGARLCSAGVLPGDLLMLDIDAECGGFAGGQLELPITALGSDYVETDLGRGRLFTLNDDLGLVDFPITDFEAWYRACVPVMLEGRVRVASSFLLSGQVSGVLGDVVETDDGCRTVQGANPLLKARIPAPNVKVGTTVPSCPILVDDGTLALTRFKNPVLSFSIYPACRTEEDGTAHTVSVKRDVKWVLNVLSSFQYRRLAVGGLPSVIRAPFEDSEVYVLDPALLSIKKINLDDLDIDDLYY